MSWRESAVCRSVDPEVFFPEKGGSTQEAKAICGQCSFTRECLDAALSSPWEEHGVWGGLSMMERRKLRVNANPRRLVTAPEFCTAGDCNRKHHARGLCRLHYQRSRMERAS